MTSKIKPIEGGHLEAVKKIEQSCFPIPWNSEIFNAFVRWHGRIFLDGRKIICMDVVEENGETAGYVVWEENHRTFQGRIMNLAVRQHSRRKGLGRLLLIHVLRSQKKNGMNVCELEVRESNYSARQLYESVGMKVSGQESNYYETEDAILYSIKL